MRNNFECRYMSVGGTYCFHYDYEIGLNDTECYNCEANNNCDCCAWKLSHQENCAECSILEEEDE